MDDFQEGLLVGFLLSAQPRGGLTAPAGGTPVWRSASHPEAVLPVASSRVGEDILALEEEEELELE